MELRPRRRLEPLEEFLFLELLAKDISFRGSLGTETRGRAAFCDYMWRVQDAFPDFHNAIEEMIAERNRACARLTYTGRHCQSSHRRYTSWGK